MARMEQEERTTSEVLNGNGTAGVRSLEALLWDAACSIRGAVEAAKFKDYILPLVFMKRLSDVFEDELEGLATELGHPQQGGEARCARPRAGSVLSPAWYAMGGDPGLLEERRPEVDGYGTPDREGEPGAAGGDRRRRLQRRRQRPANHR